MCRNKTAGAAPLAMMIAWVTRQPIVFLFPAFQGGLEGLIKLKDITMSEQSVMTSWWDYGYDTLFLNDQPTLHDGGAQVGPTTHFVASALLNSDQKETVGTLQFLAGSGIAGIRGHKSSAALHSAFNNPAQSPVPDIYLVLTAQMASWMGSISTLGNWDIDTGKPVIPQNNNGKSHVDYIGLGCNYRGFPARLSCGNVRFDLDKGLMNDASAIVGWTHARDGFAKGVRRYSDDATFALQTLQTNNRLSSQFMHRQLYDSSFNKLYHLGLIEASNITLVYDDYPHIRIYRIDGKD